MTTSLVIAENYIRSIVMSCNYRYYKNNGVMGLTGSTYGKEVMCAHKSLQTSGKCD